MLNKLVIFKIIIIFVLLVRVTHMPYGTLYACGTSILRIIMVRRTEAIMVMILGIVLFSISLGIACIMLQNYASSSVLKIIDSSLKIL